MLIALAGCGGANDGSSIRATDRFWVATTTRGGPTGGTLWSSDDGGATWRTAFTSEHELYAVAFADDEHGAAVGDGIAIVTNDGGRRWRISRAVADEVPGDIAFGRDGRGLAVGTIRNSNQYLDYIPLLLETTDAGEHWAAADVPPQLATGINEFSTTCLTASGIAFVRGPKLLRRDAHGLWAEVSELVPLQPSALTCRGHDVWIAYGRALARSRDDGLTWGVPADVVNDPAFAVDALVFADGAAGWLVGGFHNFHYGPDTPRDVLLRTSDGGATWSDASPPDEFSGHWKAVATDPDGSRALAGGVPVSLGCGDPFVAADETGTRALEPPADCEDVHGVAITRRRPNA